MHSARFAYCLTPFLRADGKPNAVYRYMLKHVFQPGDRQDLFQVVEKAMTWEDPEVREAGKELREFLETSVF